LIENCEEKKENYSLTFIDEEKKEKLPYFVYYIIYTKELWIYKIEVSLK